MPRPCKILSAGIVTQLCGRCVESIAASSRRSKPAAMMSCPSRTRACRGQKRRGSWCALEQDCVKFFRMPAHVIVIGGGLAGLSASVALADNGVRVHLLERHPRLGGRATSYAFPIGDCIDNCQHVTLRCCTNLEDFYSRMGVGEKIRYSNRLVFADSKGHQGEIRSYSLPAPLHLMPSFVFFPLLTWNDKRAIASAMLSIIRSGGRPRVGSDTTMLDWLRQNRQTENAIDRFWRVVLVSALNEELDRIDPVHGVAVFWKAFLSNREGFGVGIPSVPLEKLYSTAADRIQRANGEVRTR